MISSRAWHHIWLIFCLLVSAHECSADPVVSKNCSLNFPPIFQEQLRDDQKFRELAERTYQILREGTLEIEEECTVPWSSFSGSDIFGEVGTLGLELAVTGVICSTAIGCPDSVWVFRMMYKNELYLCAPPQHEGIYFNPVVDESLESIMRIFGNEAAVKILHDKGRGRSLEAKLRSRIRKLFYPNEGKVTFTISETICM